MSVYIDENGNAISRSEPMTQTELAEAMARVLCRMDCDSDPDAPVCRLPGDDKRLAWELYTDEATALLPILKAAVDAERERAAKVCDDATAEAMAAYDNVKPGGLAKAALRGNIAALHFAAAAIRALGDGGS